MVKTPRHTRYTAGTLEYHGISVKFSLVTDSNSYQWRENINLFNQEFLTNFNACVNDEENDLQFGFGFLACLDALRTGVTPFR